MKNIAIFASGTGSNFLNIYNSIKQHKLNANLKILISDRPKSKAVEKAKNLGINYFTFRPKKYESKEIYEQELIAILEEHKIDLIVLAGYMRLIGPTLLNRYEKRIVNIHPSLLPFFKGKDAVGQAIEAGVKVTGVTIHYVDKGMDTGTIIAQESLHINNIQSRDEIEKEIHKIEHKLYPQVINKLLEEL